MRSSELREMLDDTLDVLAASADPRHRDLAEKIRAALSPEPRQNKCDDACRAHHYITDFPDGPPAP